MYLLSVIPSSLQSLLVSLADLVELGNSSDDDYTNTGCPWGLITMHTNYLTDIEHVLVLAAEMSASQMKG